VCTGLGLAYVSQTAHATQENYDESHLIYQQGQLVTEDQQLGDQVAGLAASSRIISEAARLGMVPGGTWTYANSAAQPAGAPRAVAASVAAAAPALDAPSSRLAGALASALLGGASW